MRVVALTARSRFTAEEAEREPRLVRRRVSGDTPTVKWVRVKVVMVRHVPGVWEYGLASGGGCFRMKGQARDERKKQGRSRK